MSALDEGFAAFEKEDYTTAFGLLEPIAVQGNPEVQCIVANMYHLGLGTVRDVQKAVKLYLASAAQGYRVASNNLGTIYLTGDYDVPVDQVLAKQWYLEARKQGFSHTPIKWSG